MVYKGKKDRVYISLGMRCILKIYETLFGRVWFFMLVIALSGCSGNDGAPTVAGSNLVPVSIAMHVPGQFVAGRVRPALALPGVKSVRITISGAGFAPLVDLFNATPGLAVTRNFQVPQGANISFTIDAFNGLLGAGAVTFTGTSVVTVQPLAVGAPALAINIPVLPTAAADLVAPVITLLGVTPLDVVQGSIYVDAGATALDNVDGDITVNIAVVNPVNTSVLGAYVVTYDVADATLNNAVQVTRTVNVVAAVGVVGTFLYVNDNVNAANTVSAFSIDQATGLLTLVAGSPFVTGGAGGGGFFAANNIAVASNKNLLFVSNPGSSTIAVFSVNPNTGVLTAVAGSPFAGGGNMGSSGALEVNQAGDLLLVGNDGSNNIAVFAVAANGALTAVAGSPFAANHSNGVLTYGTRVDGMRLNGNGSVLYVTGASSGVVGAFNVAGNGALTALVASPFASPILGRSVTSIDLDALSGFAITGSTGGRLAVFSVDGVGNLISIIQVSTGNGGFKALGSGNQQAITYAPDGSKVILSGGGANGVSVVSVDTAGQLTDAIGSTFAAANSGFGYSAIHPNNLWLYSAEVGASNVVEFFNMAANGSLTSQQVIAAGARGKNNALVIY